MYTLSGLYLLDRGVGTAASGCTGEIERFPLGGRRAGRGAHLGCPGGSQDRDSVRLGVDVFAAPAHFQSALELAIVSLVTHVRYVQIIPSFFWPEVQSENRKKYDISQKNSLSILFIINLKKLNNIDNLNKERKVTALIWDCLEIK